jgi:hypothetical protein
MEFAMLGVHLYFQALTERGPELLEPKVEKLMQGISGREKREILGLGLYGGAFAREAELVMPNKLERKYE